MTDKEIERKIWNKGLGGVIIYCLNCGETRKVPPSRKYRTKYCSMECRLAHFAGPWRGKKRPGIGEKVRAKTIGRHLHAETEFRKGNIPWNKGQTKEVNKIILQLANRASERMKQRWADKLYREKFMRFTHARPNKLEKAFIAIVDKYKLPYKWNEDTIVAGRLPDFVSTEKPLRVIETFGSWWHSRTRNPKAKLYYLPQAVKTSYRKAGVRCLYIWDSQLKDERKLIPLIWRFHENTCGKPYLQPVV